jgi:group II intron reverse transcriptase/maturase
MAKGSRFPHGEDAKVREMRTAETILNIIQDRGKRKLPLDDVYRQLYNPDMYLRSYAKLYPNDGAMTPGMTEETVDGWSMEKVAAIIVAIRDERWQWTPVKRVLIDKPKGGKRPLGLPVWSDKVVQDIIRSILEAYYEPQFSKHSHGFRPKRGCHTALKEIDEVWQGTKWFIEGDIKGCFDNIDHTLLMNILRENIHDNRFLRLIEGALKAGYCEEWKYHPSLSGSPQGGIVSPILSNIYMDRLDRFVQDTVIPEYTRGTRRKEGEEYRRLHSLSTYYRNTGRIERAEELRKAMQQYPSVDPNDEEYRRLRYVRYADDFLLGYAGTLAEATEIKEKIAAFLRTQLNLTLSADKTLITHASTGRARFLGYEIGTMYCQTKFDKLRKRAVNGKIGLYIPEDVLQKKRQRYLRDGKVHHRTELMNDSEYDIIIRYQAEYRGLVQYYTLAQNRCRLGYVGFTMETSLLKTLASKGRTTFVKTLKRLKSTTQSPHGPRTCLKLTIERAGQRPLVAIFGGLSLRRKQTAIKDQVLMPYIRRRSEIVERLLNNTCEVCGSKEHIQMHHVRHLADLNKKGRREKPLWMKIMIARKRKSIPLCKRCHDDVHFNRPTFRKTRRLESRVP